MHMCIKIDSELGGMENKPKTLGFEYDESDAMAKMQEKSKTIIPNPEVADEYGYSSGWE
jgi:hypothetical protein